MPEKLMRWNGLEWVEVTSICRTEVKTIIGLRKKLSGGLGVVAPLGLEYPVINIGMAVRNDNIVKVLKKINTLVKI